MVGSWAARATTKHGESIRRWSGQPTTVCLPGCGDGRTRCRVDRIQLSDLGFGNISALRTVQRRRLHGADQRSGRYVCVIERHSVDGGRPGRGPRTFRHGEEPSRSCDRRGRDSARDMDSGVRCSADRGIDCADAAVGGQWAVFAVLPAGVLAIVGVSAILVSPAGMLDSGGDDSLDYEFSRDYALYVVFAASVIAVLCAVGALVALIRTGGSPTDSPVRHDSYVPPVRSQWPGPPPTGRWPGPPNAPYRSAGPPPPYRGQPPSSGPPNLR